MDKIVCIGKNYLDHAKELGDAVPEMPVLFLKPPGVSKQVAAIGDSIPVTLPTGRGSIHHECEIVVRLNAAKEIDAVTLGLDLTLRDLQAQLKKNGHPWEVSKVFDGSAIIGPWIPLAKFQDYLNQEFSFSIDGKIRQKGKGSEMRLLPLECLRYASEYFPLYEGDVIFTGTPAGVGPIQAGETSELRWNSELLFTVQWL
jgi:2-keto-4-pentenoate hydratase/2-oxohepta-3-ene-1,7-dioic acid hydratase in catechol pathway